MINEMIEISKGFQSSVNIEYDFNDKRKIEGFIPTNACLNIIDNVISSADGSNMSRAKILTGAYGRGKSLCVLIALSILFNADSELFANLLNKIKEVNPELAKKINNYLSSNRRILPVIINGNSGNMTQAFLGALQRALTFYRIEDIKPETYFDAAIKTIDRWKTDYPSTFEKFSDSINITPEKFISLLSDNDNETYNVFVNLYPELTSGSVFNPFVDNNVVDVYDKVNIELKKKGFSGIYVVYDEFGKYLESNITIATESETKMLQDFAEKCNREASQQLHLMLICHKDISNYIDMNLSQDKVDGWRGISGRFEHINLTNNFSQMYEIISNTINKDKNLWTRFRRINDTVFSSLYEGFNSSPLIFGKEKLVIEDCYPLHPVTTFILPRLSERVAQNERTLFTFLSSNQKNTLKQFVEKSTDDIPFVTPDYLYDYFEIELRKELNTSDIYKVYSLSSKILRKFTSDSLSAKIIKCVAVIHIIQQFERLAPTTDVICNIYSIEYGSKTVIDCIQELIDEQYILYRKSSNNFLCLKETSGIDINTEIENRTKSICNIKDVQDIVNECITLKYIYPTAYNDDICITRYFEIRFVSESNYISEINRELPYELAGVVFAVFSTGESVDNVLNNLSMNNRHITIIPRTSVNIIPTLSKYLAIKDLKEEASSDRILFDEYSIYLDDYSEILSDFVQTYILPELHRSAYYYLGEEINIGRKSQLTGLLSNICYQVYTLTPIINNESLNKDRLPGVAINSRAKILTSLLENEIIDENLGLKGTGQDVSFMRSSLIQTGILCHNDDSYYLNYNTPDENLNFVINAIQSFFRSTIEDGEKSFADLYEILTNPANAIGLKKGIIPILIAVVLHSVKKDLVFKSNGEEIKVTADLLNAINEKPELYSVKMENWNEEKAAYLIRLGEIFKEFIIEKERSFNSFAYIVGAINRWYLSLPKCSREMTAYYENGKKLSRADIDFVKSLKKPNPNAHEYLLETLGSIYNADEINAELADKIEKSRKIFDNGKNHLIKYVIKTVKQVFGSDERYSLTSILRDWYESLKPETTQHLFVSNENTILNLIATVNNDEVSFAERIGKAITGLRLNDWNNSTAKSFLSQLEIFKRTVEEFDYNVYDAIESSTSQFKMIITDENGEEKVRSFKKIDYSSRANLLYQDITAAIEEMGQSITEQKKRQVLIDILSKLCE